MRRIDSPSLLRPEALAAALAGQGPDLSSLGPEDTAAVLFLIQDRPGDGRAPGLLLTKRSPWVRQPGDLCCPGGRVHPRVDGVLGDLLALPGSPLTRGAGCETDTFGDSERTRLLGLYWACALREAWEEMGLNPWGVEFMGVLPLNALASSVRGILPLVGWTEAPQRFRPNDEVERVVSIPFASLLERGNYCEYRLEGDWSGSWPGFVCEHEGGREVLWGATYRIVTTFLEIVFGFEPPRTAGRPVITGTLDSAYATGRRRPG